MNIPPKAEEAGEETTHPQPPDAADHPRIEGDVLCAICSYNLRGLSVVGVCPECGRDVRRTLEEDLSLADPAWVRYQARTMIWLMALCLVNSRPISLWFGDSFLTFPLLSAAASIATAYACWRLARPEGHRPPSDMLATQRRGLVISAIVVAASQVFVLASMILLLRTGDHSDKLFGLNLIVGLVALICSNWLAMLQVRRFVRGVRPADPGLVSLVGYMVWIVPLCQLAAIALSGAVFVLFDRASNIASIVHTIGPWLISVTFFVAAFMFGRMFEVLSRVTPRSVNSTSETHAQS